MSQGVCRFFNAAGKCRFGKHCRFSHIRETIETSPSVPQNSNGILSETGLEENPVLANQFSSTQQITKEDGSLNNQKKNSPEGAVPPESNLCRSYARNRFCRYGKRCRYLHIQLPKSKERGSRNGTALRKSGYVGRTAGAHFRDDEKEEEEEIEGEEVQNEDADLNEVLKNVRVSEEGSQRKVCRFFRQGYCHYGNKCRFLHQKRGNEKPTEGCRGEKEEQGSSETPRVVRPAFQAPHIQVYNRETVSEETLKQLRETELRQLKRRFPKEKLEVVEEGDTLGRFIITFSPTDPDWPYEVKVFLIEVEFPDSYPLQLFKLSLPVEQDLPETVRRFIEVSIREWAEKKSSELESKGSVELIFRPFLRWLDRNMQEMVTEGLRQLRRELTAKAAGFEFISAKQLQKEAETKPGDAAKPPDDADQTSEHSDDSDESEEGYPEAGFTVAYRKDENIPEDTYLGPERDQQIDDHGSSDDDDEDNNEDGDGNDDTKDISKLVSPDTERKGTEMVFRNMQLYYFSASILVEKLQLSIQCERCKHNTEFPTPPNRVNSVACGKCNNTQLVAYRAVLAHPYSSTFGYLDMEGCAAFDINLQKSIFSITCMQCNKSSTVKTFIPGRPYETICRGCHSKKKFGAEAVKLTKVAPSVVDTSSYSGSIHKVNVKKFSRLGKDPAIQEGKPLPDNGACKHYKKSYRWFRFPCCGKCYPCDVCHDDNEGDHDMKFANRMICGFCCKEQPFAGEKPCVACSSALTKVRSTHWEGGKGCRNKISMSRDDAKKYSSMNKTVSRKAQEKTTGKTTTKNTKLRHA